MPSFNTKDFQLLKLIVQLTVYMTKTIVLMLVLGSSPVSTLNVVNASSFAPERERSTNSCDDESCSESLGHHKNRP